MKRRNVRTGEETNKLWFNVYHPEAVDEFDQKVSQVKKNFACNAAT